MEVPRGFTRCDECAVENGGNGKGWAKGFPPIGRPCPSCSGSGLLPTEKLREDIAADLFNVIACIKEPQQARDAADAVLRKVAEHLKEER